MHLPLVTVVVSSARVIGVVKPLHVAGPSPAVASATRASAASMLAASAPPPPLQPAPRPPPPRPPPPASPPPPSVVFLFVTSSPSSLQDVVARPSKKQRA